tara:strand:+ start:172 stop:405 length:234 start_codon:yes stop_codon:yes gene_type:complete
MSYRLTVHIDKAPEIVSKESKSKTGIQNTISVRNLKTKNDVDLALARLKSKYTITKGSNNKKMHKYGKELIYVSNEK